MKLNRIKYAHHDVTRWQYFKVIQWPKILWYASGMFIWDEMYSYWWLNIAKREVLWDDASQEGCAFRYCRYCGKGKI